MLNVLQIAIIVHEANRAYCSVLGDDSQPSWQNAPEWQKASAILGVGMHVDNPNASAEDSHKSWLKQKEQEGWTYGPIKDSVKKEHPCFCPYSELPEEQKRKDYLFKGIVHALVHDK